MRWLGVAGGLALACAGCSSTDDATRARLFGDGLPPSGTSESSGGRTGIGGVSGCTGASCGGATCEDPASCAAMPHPPPCAAFEKECAGLCAEALPENGCADPSCTPCPTTEHGKAACFGDKCGVICEPGFVEMGAVCQAPPVGCTDGTKNGTETDVDCGGSCPRCQSGKGCAIGADCMTAACVNATCATSSCSNGVQDSSETAIDCGGPDCPHCANGERCRVGSDCVEGSCTATLCQASTCDDRTRNGRETGVDCGGSCAPCGPGAACSVNADCASAHCVASRCRVTCPMSRNKDGCPECAIAVAEPCCRTDDFCGCSLNGLVCNL